MIKIIIFLVFVSMISLIMYSIYYAIMMSILAESAMRSMGKTHMMSRMMDYEKEK
jgi:hypothetical protein